MQQATNVFAKHSEIESMVSINSSKKEIVLSCDTKFKAHGGAKSKNKHLSWLCCTVAGLSEAATIGVP